MIFKDCRVATRRGPATVRRQRDTERKTKSDKKVTTRVTSHEKRSHDSTVYNYDFERIHISIRMYQFCYVSTARAEREATAHTCARRRSKNDTGARHDRAWILRRLADGLASSRGVLFASGSTAGMLEVVQRRRR